MPPIRLAIGITTITSPFARDFRPEGRLENLPASDSSVQQCYIFRTVPGVQYRVERSHDLTEWSAEEELYGLGHEFVVAMREFTPPPPPVPGAPPTTPYVPAIRASVRLQPSSGVAGGTIVSWVSLDHGGPVIMLLPQALTAGWSQMPLFWDRYGAHDFFIFHNRRAIPPPDENPVLDPKDAAMFAQLEAHFPAMNLAVDASIARARNTPPPAPPDPSSRKFWRVHCEASIRIRTAAPTGPSLKWQLSPPEAPAIHCGRMPSTATPTATAPPTARSSIRTAMALRMPMT